MNCLKSINRENLEQETIQAFQTSQATIGARSSRRNQQNYDYKETQNGTSRISLV